MANKIWILTADADENYQCVIHTPTPAGNNSAGFSWASCLVAAGLNATILGVGSGAGQQTQAEHDAVVAGTTIEIVRTFSIAGNNANATQVAALRDQVATDYVNYLGHVLKWFGFTE
ncbi:MAG: hypothetical protein KGL35_03250 [Bradyrhizobium sp.]|nr:hypothetical protein [Bradyrhizobium sp.]